MIRTGRVEEEQSRDEVGEERKRQGQAGAGHNVEGRVCQSRVEQSWAEQDKAGLVGRYNWCSLARRAEQSQLDSNDCQEIERGTGEGALARSARVWQGKAIKWGKEQSKMSPGMAGLPRTVEVSVHQKRPSFAGEKS